MLTYFVCKVLVKMRPHSLQMNVLQQKIGQCCFRTVCEVLNDYGPILPIPTFVHDSCPNFYRLMTTDWTLMEDKHHSNIPMLFAILVFLMARAEVSQRVDVQHKASQDHERFRCEFRLDCITYLTHLQNTGELRFVSE